MEKYKHQVSELLSTIKQLEARLKQLSESCKASESCWNKALQEAEKEIRIRKIRSVIMVVAAFLAGAGPGYSIEDVVDGRRIR